MFAPRAPLACWKLCTTISPVSSAAAIERLIVAMLTHAVAAHVPRDNHHWPSHSRGSRRLPSMRGGNRSGARRIADRHRGAVARRWQTMAAPACASSWEDADSLEAVRAFALVEDRRSGLQMCCLCLSQDSDRPARDHGSQRADRLPGAVLGGCGTCVPGGASSDPPRTHWRRPCGGRGGKQIVNPPACAADPPECRQSSASRGSISIGANK